MTTRRDFLATLGAALGATSLAACASNGQAAESRRTLGRVGIQLYTLRSLLAKDFEGTIAKVAGIGYKEVEFAGYYNRTPAQIRSVLASNGLTTPSSHIGLPATDDAWKRAVDEAKVIGHEWAIIPWLDAAMRKNGDDYLKFADRLNRLGTIAHGAGLRFGYHNHDFELKPNGDVGRGLDILLKNTDPALVDFEMDIFWVVKAGGDPLDYLARYPKRFPLMHVKDATAAPALAMTDVGKGTIAFATIFKKNTALQHAFVEHDEPADPLASATASYNHLATLQY
jgi:sugar phosphate isomerase/epimerase